MQPQTTAYTKHTGNPGIFLSLSYLLLLLLLFMCLPILVQGQDVELSKTARPNPVQAGGVLSYTITLTNHTGAPMNGALVTDTVPAKTTYITGTMNAQADVLTPTQPIAITPGNLLTWTIGSLAEGQAITMTFQVLVDSPLISGTHVFNQAVFSDTTAQGDTTIHSDHTLAVTKTAPLNVEAGGLLTYTIAWAVSGNEPAAGVTISDALPAHTSYQGCGPQPCGEAGGVVSWTLATVSPTADSPVSGTAVLTLEVEAPLTDSLPIENTAFLYEDGDKRDLSSATTFASSEHTLAITKTAPVTAQTGTFLTYTMVYTVAGNGIAQSVTITDRLGADTPFRNCDPMPCGEDGGLVTWDLGNLKPGTSTTTLTVELDRSIISGTLIANTAHVQDEDGQSDQATAATMAIRRRSRLYVPLIVKSFPPRIVVNGGFETGDTSGWQAEGDAVLPPPRVVGWDPPQGDYDLLLGDHTYCNTANPGLPGDHTSTISQTIQVPDTPETPLLRFQYYLFTYDHLTWTNGSTLGDSLDVYVGGDLALRDNFENYPSPIPGCTDLQKSGWRTPDNPWFQDGGGGLGVVDADVLDLSEWKGQPVTIYFELRTRHDGYYNTWAYLDDVQVELLP